MNEQKINELIKAGRNFMRSPDWAHKVSDQDKKLPQPPLYQLASKDAEIIILPRNFEDLKLETNLFDLLKTRKSRRVYSEEKITLLELSFLLWSIQGIKDVRGKKYATLRTVPSAGARHAFETYIDAQKVDGLKPGIYHYLAGEHALEYVGQQSEEDRVKSVEGQVWAAKAAALFYFSFVAYRMEWRYSNFSHRVGLIDLGHVGENLYLACETLELGTCGIGAFSQETCDRVLSLDGEEEYTVYVQPVGKVKEGQKNEESIFYAFVEEEGW